MMSPAPDAPPALTVTAPAAPCDAAFRARLLAPPGPGTASIQLDCSIRMLPGDRIAKRVILEGQRASGAVLDCNGATIGTASPSRDPTAFALEVRSVPPSPTRTAWDRPSQITIRGCNILGHVRVWGMGWNGQGAAVRDSSHALGHTERAQAAAPTDVRILDSTVTAFGAIPIYIAPGVTRFTLAGSSLRGSSSSTALYLDAESAENTIADNDFKVATGREAIAVDGSARNRITGNHFELGGQGAVRLYRNCGEGGTVRHQTPSFNVITGNVFRGSGFLTPAIVVNSRGGWRLYCGEDAGYSFGSSIDDRDGGVDNVVEPNTDE